jgi:hypothetical protein
MNILEKTLHKNPTPMNDVQLTSLQTEQLLDKLIDSGNEISSKRLALLCHKAMGLKTEMGLERVMVAMEACKLFDKKQSDYGSRNIDSWGEKNMNVLGIGVRVNDKIQRLVNLTKKRIGGDGTPEVEDESLSDTAIDITNYGAILTLLLENRWK